MKKKPPKLTLHAGGGMLIKAVPFEEFERIAKVMRRHGIKPPDVFQSPAAFWGVIAGFIEELDCRLDPPPRPPERAA